VLAIVASNCARAAVGELTVAVEVADGADVEVEEYVTSDDAAAGTSSATFMPMPTLGNTAAGDLPLLVEIGDGHVHGQADSPTVGGPDATPPSDVWTRVRTAGRLTVPDNEAIRDRETVYRGEVQWISKILHRATPYVAHVVAELDGRFLPPELALLPVIESGFRPHALSPNEASGLWQIIPATAREIGIERSEWYDGRADVVISTTAALDYLSSLNATFHGDWELTLAAYNAGPGRVRQAILRNRNAGKGLDFWSLRLPGETRAYVPKLLALLSLLRDPDGGLDVPGVPLEPAFTKVDVGRRISLDRAAAVGAVNEQALRRLNAGLTRGVTPPTGPHELYVPSASRDDFLARIASAEPGPLFSLPDTHDVVAGDTLGAIALAYGITEARLRTLNGLDGPDIRIGQTLAVLDARHADGASVEHIVKSGDTLSGIARRYDVDLGDITDRDGVAPTPALIRPGDTLLVNLLPPEASSRAVTGRRGRTRPRADTPDRSNGGRASMAGPPRPISPSPSVPVDGLSRRPR